MASPTNAQIARYQTNQFQQRLAGGQITQDADYHLMPYKDIEFVRVRTQGERLMASAPVMMDVWDAPGDGSYTASGVPIVGTGVANKAGIQFAVGMAAGSMVVNSMAKRKAVKDSQKRWLPFIARGIVTVSTHGFYISHPEGEAAFMWNDIQNAKVTGPSTVELLFVNQPTFRFQLRSDWAELIFALWTEAVAPEHPQRMGWYREQDAVTEGAEGGPAVYGRGSRALMPPKMSGAVGAQGSTGATIALVLSILGFITGTSLFGLLFGTAGAVYGFVLRRGGDHSKRTLFAIILGALGAVAGLLSMAAIF
ncbi:hypothetical protein I6H91_01395 [Micrococcus luteus]|uniref:hypothetical protein n=1 Tax=Micrococcus luteus TaxID=1270 RepID=UPI001910AA83|nr:hypothetical protein [Micrococcus luteus]QQE49026.1 hypothetical protein I6H91_01395 [Micrococcus luteus]